MQCYVANVSAEIKSAIKGEDLDLSTRNLKLQSFPKLLFDNDHLEGVQNFYSSNYS